LRPLLGSSANTSLYLKLGRGAGHAYFPVTPAHPTKLAASAPAGARLSFTTSSLGLLGEVLRAGTNGGRISHVSLVLRTPGQDGRPVTELVETFATAEITAFSEHLSGTPTGRVSLALPAAAHLVTAPGMLRRVGPFPRPPGPSAAKTFLAIGAGRTAAPPHPVTAVTLSQTAPHAPLSLRFTTSALPLLEGIFRGQHAAIPALTLSVRAGGPPHATAMAYTFSRLSVRSFAENLSGSVAATAILLLPPR
jgi:hypothetical protein